MSGAIVNEYGAEGPEAIFDWLSWHKEGELSDKDIDLLAYTVLLKFGFDDNGRQFALHWIDYLLKKHEQPGELNRLREQLLITERGFR